MYTILIIIGFIGVIVSGIQVFTSFTDERKKKKLKQLFIFLALTIVSSSLLSLKTPKSEKSETEVKNIKAIETEEKVEVVELTEETEENTDLDFFKRMGEKVFGDSLEKVKYIEDDNTYWIHAQMKDNWDEDAIRRMFLKRVMEYMSLVRGENFGNLSFDGYFDMVDAYNNVDNRSVIHIEFTRETVSKFNFDNSSYDYDNLLLVADQLRIHNVFEKK